MHVWKFGGTSVGKPERMQSIRELRTEDDTRKVVVLSALSGTTNALLSIGEALKEIPSQVPRLALENALGAANSTRADSPADASAWRDLGWTPLSLQRYHEAVACYYLAIAMAPGHAAHWFYPATRWNFP